MALLDGILAYWKLDDDNGSVSLVDSTGNGNTLSLEGTVGLGSGFIGSGSASFTGDGSYLAQSSVSTLPTFSVSLWFKQTEVLSLFDGFLSIDGPGAGLDVINGSAKPFRVYSQATDTQVDSGTEPIFNSWNHFVITNDGTTITLYLNGVSVGDSPNNSDTMNWVLFGLCVAGDTSGYFSGLVSEAGTWDRAITSQEVEFLYNNGGGISYPFLQLYYNNAQEDGDWGNLLNWWQDDAFTIQADALPTSSNPINLYNAVSQNSQGANQCFCSSANFWSANFGTGLTLQASAVVNMYGGSVLSGTTTDGVSMHDSSYIDIPGVVGGNAVLRDSSRNTGLIQGNATVYYDMGNGQFPIGGTVIGSVTYIDFPVTTVYFNDKNTEDQDWSNYLNWWNDAEATIQASNIPDDTIDVIVNSKSIYYVTGSPAICKSATFNNYGIIGIDFTTVNGAVFNNGVNDGGVITGNATFNGDSYQSGAVTGLAKFTSNLSLNNSFGYNGLSTGAIDSFEAAIPTKKKISISSLLGFPWFINF
jgi:hypothetical protein